MQSARAMATRCCWPPESWPGYFFACSGMRTRVRYSIASSSASFFGIRRTQIGASVQFSRIVRCGNRLKDWNTMPTSRRMASRDRRSSDSSIPSTMILPSWCVSSRLMQRISVDLPEPDGPQTTTRSPLATERFTSRSTCRAPNHLFTPCSTMAGGASARTAEAIWASVSMVSLMVSLPVFRHPAWGGGGGRGSPRGPAATAAGAG